MPTATSTAPSVSHPDADDCSQEQHGQHPTIREPTDKACRLAVAGNAYVYVYVQELQRRVEHGAADADEHHEDIEHVKALLEAVLDRQIQAGHAKHKEQHVGDGVPEPADTVTHPIAAQGEPMTQFRRQISIASISEHVLVAVNLSRSSMSFHQLLPDKHLLCDIECDGVIALTPIDGGCGRAPVPMLLRHERRLDDL